MFEYNDLISRNWAFIDSKTQKIIKNTPLLITGCGLSSYVAELAVRTGFGNLSLVDNDLVELSNLNRQNFSLNDLNKLKTVRTKKKLLAINSQAKINDFNIKIDEIAKIKKIVNSHKIVINTVDISPVYFEIIKLAGDNNSLIILPFNVGFGSCVIVLNNRNYQSFIKQYGDANSDMELLLKIAKNLSNTENRMAIPQYLASSLGGLSQEIKMKKYNPQLGIASFLTSAICISQVLLYLENKKVNYFPKVNYLDLYNIKD